MNYTYFFVAFGLIYLILGFYQRMRDKNILREKVKSAMLDAIFKRRKSWVRIEYPMDSKYVYVTDLKSGLTSKHYEISEYYGIIMWGGSKLTMIDKERVF